MAAAQRVTWHTTRYTLTADPKLQKSRSEPGEGFEGAEHEPL